MELLLPWSKTLLDLLLDLKDSCLEVLSVVMDSVSAVAVYNTGMISESPRKLLPLLCK